MDLIMVALDLLMSIVDLAVAAAIDLAVDVLAAVELDELEVLAAKSLLSEQSSRRSLFSSSFGPSKSSFMSTVLLVDAGEMVVVLKPDSMALSSEFWPSFKSSSPFKISA